jgi:hypothetical protein
LVLEVEPVLPVLVPLPLLSQLVTRSVDVARNNPVRTLVKRLCFFVFMLVMVLLSVTICRIFYDGLILQINVKIRACINRD